ncbi:MAG TPA: serine protease [Miltoncostaea sp.]|nr:serine protease [Miltoncostaea sp.]
MRALLLALLILMAGAGTAAAAATAGEASAVPSDLSTDPLDRGVLLALPSVYRVETTLRVNAIKLRNGDLLKMPSQGRDIPLTGTGVGVSPDGWVVTAGHVAAPAPETIARLAYQQREAFRGSTSHSDVEAAEQWVQENGAEAVPGRVVSTVLTPARVGGEPVDGTPYQGLETRPSGDADLALVRIHAPGAPAVPMEEARSAGTPVATIGFSGDDVLMAGHDDTPAGEPTIRRGEIRRTGLLEPGTPRERPGLSVSADVQSGDSGGPVIDGDGALRGIIIERGDGGGGYAETSTQVRQFMQEQGLEPAPGPAAAAYRDGMAALWRLDLTTAARDLDQARQASPRNALAVQESARARALAGSPFTLRADDRREGILLGIAVLAIVGAGACGLALARPALPRVRGGGGGR